MRLETDRLLLRDLRSEDVETLVSVWSDPEVTRFLGGPRAGEQVRVVLLEELEEQPLGPLGMWPVIQKASGELVGHCGLLPKEIEGRDEVELIYVLACNEWGKGCATEIGSALLGFATEDLCEERVVSLIDAENLASRRVAEKLGMHQEAVVKRGEGIERELWVAEVAAAQQARRVGRR